MTLLWIALAAAALLLGAHLATMLRLSKLRRAGIYPQPGQATITDVERLLKSGLPVWAVRCYREIHGCDLRQAKEAVAKLSSGAK